MALACARCSRTNREGASFCDGCGAPLVSPAADALGAMAAARNPGDLFVGRENELALLRSAVEHALAGRGRILALAGEPGIGKTRTAQVLAAWAEPIISTAQTTAFPLASRSTFFRSSFMGAKKIWR